jgi:hypothetical protein
LLRRRAQASLLDQRDRPSMLPRYEHVTFAHPTAASIAANGSRP